MRQVKENEMLHWRAALMFGVVVALVAMSAIGGGFHWSTMRAF